MSKQIIAEAYASVLDSCCPRKRRSVRLQLLDDDTLVIADWSDENDLFDSGSELLLSPPNVAMLRQLLAGASAPGDEGEA